LKKNLQFKSTANKQLEDSTSLQFSLWDQDLVGRDYLGEISFPLSSFQKEWTETSSQWYKVKGKDDKINYGEIHLKIGYTGEVDNQAILKRKAASSKKKKEEEEENCQKTNSFHFISF